MDLTEETLTWAQSSLLAEMCYYLWWALASTTAFCDMMVCACVRFNVGDVTALKKKIRPSTLEQQLEMIRPGHGCCHGQLFMWKQLQLLNFMQQFDENKTSFTELICFKQRDRGETNNAHQKNNKASQRVKGLACQFQSLIWASYPRGTSPTVGSRVAVKASFL